MIMRHLRLRPVLAFLALLAILNFIGCGGSNNSNNTGANNGNPNPGGSNNGNSGGNGGNSGGSGGSGGGSSSSSRYLYVGAYIDQGSIFGFRFDPTSGSLTKISDSSLVAGTALSGVLASQGSVVYSTNSPSSSDTQVLAYRADQGTGNLTKSGSAVLGSGGTAATDVRMMETSPSGQTLYVVSQSSVYAIATNNGNPSLLNSQVAGDVIFGFALAGNFAFVGVQNGNPKDGFQTPIIRRIPLAADGSLGTPADAITLTGANIPSALAADPSGKFLAATAGMNNSVINMYAIGPGGTLTSVGLPASTENRTAKYMDFDPSGKFLYLLTNEEAVPNQESVIVYSLGSDGTLTQVQVLDMPSDVRGNRPLVQSDYVFVVNNTVSSVQGSVTVLRRDASSGKLTNVGSTSVSTALEDAAMVQF